MQLVLAGLFQQAMIHAPEVIMSIVVAILLPFVVKWIKAKASKEDLARIIQVADVAYLVVEQIARRTPGKLDDKAAEAIRIMRDDLKTKVSKKDEVKVRALLAARHEAEKRVPAVLATQPISGQPGSAAAAEALRLSQAKRISDDDDEAASLLPRR